MTIPITVTNVTKQQKTDIVQNFSENPSPTDHHNLEPTMSSPSTKYVFVNDSERALSSKRLTELVNTSKLRESKDSGEFQPIKNALKKIGLSSPNAGGIEEKFVHQLSNDSRKAKKSPIAA